MGEEEVGGAGVCAEGGEGDGGVQVCERGRGGGVSGGGGGAGGVCPRGGGGGEGEVGGGVGGRVEGGCAGDGGEFDESFVCSPSQTTRAGGLMIREQVLQLIRQAYN